MAKKQDKKHQAAKALLGEYEKARKVRKAAGKETRSFTKGYRSGMSVEKRAEILAIGASVGKALGKKPKARVVKVHKVKKKK